MSALVAPIILAYEGGVAWLGGISPNAIRTGADAWMRRSLAGLGLTDHWFLPLALLLILLGWQAVRPREWRFSPAIVAGMLVESVVLAVCLAAGFRPQHWTSILVALAIMILIAIVFAALGTALGSLVQDMQGFQLLMNFLVLPIFFLSGALFPLDHLPKALAVITALDPLTYGIDALRHTLINAPHFGLAIDFAVLVALGAVFLAAGARLFSKIQI